VPLALSAFCELCDGGEDLVVHGLAAHVSLVVDDDEARVGPRAGDLPRCPKRRAHVETAVDQNAGDPGKPVRIAEKCAFLEPGAV
jgi:hypothetical protein